MCWFVALFRFHLVSSKRFVSGGVLSLLIGPDSFIAFVKAQKSKGRRSLEVTAGFFLSPLLSSRTQSSMIELITLKHQCQ